MHGIAAEKLDEPTELIPGPSMAAILIVDDEIGIRDFMAEALADHGHEVHQAADGEEAMIRLRDQPYDLVLLDLNMPGKLGGLDVLRWARAQHPRMQAIVLTAHGTVGTAVEAMRLGAFDFLEKPVESPESVRRLVKRALNWRAGAGNQARPPDVAAVLADPHVATPAPEGTSRLTHLLREARRRHVYRVAVGYAAVGFIVLQAAQLLLPALPGLPEWSYRVLVGVVIGGFFVALVLGWLYDLTSSGIRRSRGSEHTRT